MVRSASAGMKPMSNNRQEIRSWSPEEEAQLLALLDEGMTATELGERLGRSRQAVYGRLERFRKQRGRVSRTKRTRLRAMDRLAGGVPPRHNSRRGFASFTAATTFLGSAASCCARASWTIATVEATYP